MRRSQKNSVGVRKDPKLISDHGDPAVVPLRGPDTLESTMPPTPLRELLAAEGASVYVLTDETGLLDTVQQAGGDQYPVFLAKTWRELRDAIVEGRCGVALLDLDAVSEPLTGRLNELSRLSPALVTLVAGARDRADGLLDLLSQRKIHRLLIKPPTVGITRLLLESSVNRHMELRRRPEGQAAAGRANAGAGGLAGWPIWVTAGVLAIGLAAAVALTVFMTQPGTGPTAADTVPETSAPGGVPAATVPAATAPAIGPTPTQGPNSNMATAAGAAEPVDPALANVPVAVAGPFPLEDVEPEPAGPTAEELEARYAEIEAALVADEDLDAVADLLTALETVDAGSSRLAFLEAQLERARTAAELAAAAQAAAAAAEAAANPSELTSLIGLTRARLAQGQLDAPAGDSAIAYLGRARSLGATVPEVVALTEEVGAALVDAAQAELTAGRLQAAEALLTRAQVLDITGPGVAALELGLSVAEEARTRAEQDALLVTAAERRTEGLLFAPAGESALDALLEARRLDPGHPGLPNAAAALEAALAGSAEAAIAAGDWEGGDSTLEALSRLGAAETVIEPLRGDLDFGRTQQAYLAEPSPAAELEVLEFAPPVYPVRALNRGTQGWVDLEFVVDREGRPRDLLVVAAEPPGEFDEAAVTAVGDYVFVPFERDGRVYERRISLRLRFALQ